jgi:hypothetical protein
MSAVNRKAEDSAEGCRALAQADCDRAAETRNDHMRATFERSARAWATRASLLERLEANFTARAAAVVEEKRGAVQTEGNSDG